MKTVTRDQLRGVLARRRAANERAREAAARVIAETRLRGDLALREFTRLFDGLEIVDFRVPAGEIRKAADGFLDPEWRARLDRVAARIREFAEADLPRGFTRRDRNGSVERAWIPVESAGIYVPAGTAPLVSTVLMTVIPAQAAGVKRIALCSPPDRSGRVNPAVLAAAAFLGVEEVYRLGGAQAIAALALGTGSVPRVRLVAGPGNEFVTEAKRLLYGEVALDCPAGPSEVTIYADDTAEAAPVVAELAAQAEHHSGLAVLLSGCPELLAAAAADPAPGWALETRSEEEAVDLINEIAPEHLVLVCRKARALARRTTAAGAVFLGPWSPVALGDYLAGPSHVLPTGGSAASFAGLSTHTFLRPVARVEWRRAGLEAVAGDIAALAGLEGLPAHRESVLRRLDRGKAGPRGT